MDTHEATELIALAERASAGLDALEAREWRDRVDREYSRLESACEWLIAHGRPDDAVRIATALEKYWMMSGRLAEGRVLLDRVLAASSTSDDSQARALFAVGMLAFWQGDDIASKAAHAASLEASRRAGDPNAEALALSGLARLALRDGRIADARSLSDQALNIAGETTEIRGRSSALHVLSVAAQMSGDLDEARDKMRQRMELERAAGSLRLVAGECSNLSSVERQLGNIAVARDLAIEALDISVQQEDVWAMPYVFNQLAAIEAASGGMERAATLLATAASMVAAQGAGWPPDEAPVFEQTRDACERALGVAAFQRLWTVGESMSWQSAAALARSANVRAPDGIGARHAHRS